MPNPRIFCLIKMIALVTLIMIPCQSLVYPVYASSCDNESLNISRTCPYKDNITEYLMTIRKGGSNVLSAADYDKNFFLCEQYTFDCGYVEDQTEGVSVANGVQLKMTNSQVDAILPANATLATTLKRYLNLSASEAKCGMKVFPLSLTSAESDLVFTNYMNILTTEIQSRYNSQRMNNTKPWSNLNINIKTAVLQVIKEDKLLMDSVFWDQLKWNNFTEMSSYLKNKYRSNNKLFYLRSAYLIDSVTQRCNKYQSITFLIDESGSIGVSNFQLAKDFLSRYINSTYDDLKLTSVHFFDSTFEPYINFGKNQTQILAAIASKSLRGGGTTTGDSINKTIQKILAANFDKGLNKILVVMTDGKSYDNVLDASNYARSKGITMIAVGIGPAIYEPQLLEIAQTPSNVIKVSSYADLDKLVSFIENYFCKQIINVKVNETVIGNVVRVPESPAYFKLEKSTKNETFELRIEYETNPDDTNLQMYRSDYDPFADEFSDQSIGQTYNISLLERVYFVKPVEQDTITVKKNYQKVQSFTNSYVSVGGTNMKFNISLSPCNSTGCASERASYQGFGSKKDSTPTSDKNYNIYGIIAGSIAALACLSLIGALALKKMTGDEEEEEGLTDAAADDKFHPELTEHDINDHDSRSSHSRRSSRKSQQNSSRKSDDQIDSRITGRSKGSRKLINNPRKTAAHR